MHPQLTHLCLILLVVGAGALTTVQAALNAELRASLGHSALAAAVNFLVGFLFLLALVLVLRIPVVSNAGWATVPGWAFTSGILGAVFVTIIAYAVRDLGSAFVIALIVTGQLVAAMVLDHYGVLGFRQQTVSLWRILGCLFLVFGVLLIKRG